MLRIPGLPSSLHYGNLVNRACPLNRGLVSWWLTLPQGGKGNTFFDIASRNHGTLTNGPTWGGALGRPAGMGAVVFDGTDDSVTASSDLGLAGTVDLSLGLWIKSSDGNPDRGICGAWSTPGWMLYKHGGTGIRLYAGSASESVLWAGGDTSVFDGKWHHLFGTCSGTTGTIYFDGVQQASGAIAANKGTPGVNFQVCSYNNRHTSSQSCFAGNADDVRVFNRGLSASEVWSLFNDSRQGYPLTINRVRPYSVVDVGGAAATTRRHDLMLLGIGC